VPEEALRTGVDRVVSAIGAVAPGLDATTLAEALWLASRMASVSPLDAPEPDGSSPASARDPRSLLPAERAPRVDDFAPRDRPATQDDRSDRPLHERLPGSTGRVTGHAVAVPRATALPSALEMTRALRPWKRPWRKGRRQALDLDVTVESYARSGELIPVFAPAPERWFDLVLVVDRSASMQVWRETVDAFAGLLDRLGAFRTLQVLDLTVAPDPGVELGDRQGRPFSAGRLGSPDGRRLVVVVSDCAAPAWRAPAIWQQLRSWASHEPVALLNPLPTKLWRRTGLDLPTVRVTPDAPGTGNTGLAFRLPPLLSHQAEDADPDAWLALPVLSLSPHSLGRWSRTVMLAAPEGCSAALIPPGGRLSPPGASTPPARRSAEARTDAFLRTAAPAAARLAVLTSVFDRLSLDLLYVLRQELVPKATTEDLAELLGSGLYALDTDTGGSVVLRPAPQVRAHLEEALTEHDTLLLSRALSRHISSGRDGGGRLSAVVGGADGAEEIAAEATPAGMAWARTLELLGLPVPSGRTEPTENVGATTPPDPTDLALRLALALLPRDRPVTTQELDDVVDGVVTMLAKNGLAPGRTALRRELEAAVAQFIARPTVLDDVRDHESWLAQDDDTRPQAFWERYRRFLDYGRNLPPRQVHQLDAITHDLLSRLEDPRRPGHWHRSGLVMAPLGMGRSTTVIGLAAKAIDAGYRTVVVLAGTTNAERAQMQRRVDEGLLGFDSQYTRYSDRPDYIGAGAMPHSRLLNIVSLTDSTEQGDFVQDKLFRLTTVPEAFAQVFVIKKNRRIIDGVRKGLRHQAASNNLPLLVLDMTDEPTVAVSSPSAGDTSVQRLLAAFERTAYIGYAYAPFRSLPQMLPDFVYNSPEPAQQDSVLVHMVTDQTRWLPAGHRADHVPDRELPDSLSTALQSFVLACAVRAARGQAGANNSMMVSVSRFVAVQQQVRHQIDERIRDIADLLRDSRSPRVGGLMADFEHLWRTDFLPNSEAYPDMDAPAVTWEQVAEQLTPAVRKITVVAFNGRSDTALRWHESGAKGVSVIVVGGAKLTPAITLEGLTVSYCLWSSSGYETLRALTTTSDSRTGYEDLRRLYASRVVLGARQSLPPPLGERREELREMAEQGVKPADAALRLRKGPEAHPGMSWETTHFTLAHEVLYGHLEVLAKFLHHLGEPDPYPANRDRGNRLWSDVPPGMILTKFLESYVPASDGDPEALGRLISYIHRCVGFGELGRWTVQLVSAPKARAGIVVEGHHVGLVLRRPIPPVTDSYTIRRLSSPANEYADLDEDQYAAALEATRSAAAADPARSGGVREPRVPSRTAVSAVRGPDQALLSIYLVTPELPDHSEPTTPLVGFVMSLPRSATLSATSALSGGPGSGFGTGSGPGGIGDGSGVGPGAGGG
jgi:hypothetical protein